MNNKKIGVTLAVIMLASIFAVMPFPAAVQAGVPPAPPTGDGDNQVLTENQLLPGSGGPYGSTLRVYGEDDMGPVVGYGPRGQFVYPNWYDPFDPTALEKDVLTFNPAVVKFEYGTMQANGSNAYLKKFLRIWYEPEHKYSKNALWGDAKTYTYSTIEVETTYMLVDEQDYIPTHGRANKTHFVFPIAERPLQTGLAAFENDNFTAPLFQENMTRLVWVNGSVPTSYNKTTDGTIRLEKGYTLSRDETVQFLDHKLTYKWIVKDPQDGKYYAKVVAWYAGNIEDDSPTWITLGQFDDGTAKDPKALTFLDRHNNRYGTPSHADHRTWYAAYQGTNPWYQANIILGKEISANDTFYVNAVRYDVPAVEVLDDNGDTWADAFKYITLRTPLPKSSTSVLWPDDGKVSSQWIDTIAPYEIIPVNPPFNGPYTMVDDINIVLWYPNANEDEWPHGDPAGEIGTEYWPWAERYLTMQADEIEKEVWCANNLTVGLEWMDYFDVLEGSWVTDPALREVPADALRFCYVAELEEERYTTDLVERLWEDLPGPTPSPTAPPLEYWDTIDVRTLPNRYTEFALPKRGEATTSPLTKNGDYLLTTSFLAKNSVNRSDIVRNPPGLPRATFAFDVEYEWDVNLNKTKPMGDGQDIYVNRYTNVSSSVRIYGEKDYGPIPAYGIRGNGTHIYQNYDEPFDPAAIRKDSITFNPAIVQWSSDYPSSGFDTRGFNAELKKYLRMWYEPEHVYSKPTYKRPTIEVESTYMIIDRQDKEPAMSIAGRTHIPFPIAEDRSNGFPAVGLELFENPAGIPMRQNLVTVSYVNGSVAMYNKTTEGIIRLEKTYTLAPGERVQFLDHGLEYSPQQVNEYNQTFVDIWYMGNPADQKILTGFALGTPANPNQMTWFDREGNDQFTSEHNAFKWYARMDSYSIPYGDTAQFTIGMELTPGDHFYVDGVRYDVAAIEVIDGDGITSNGAELFKYITIRTPLPKRDGIFVTDAQVPDGNADMGIDSQDIWTYRPYDILPVNPPFNMDDHDIVDDILDAGCGLSEAERIIEGYPALEVFYVNETIEPRYSTNLLEILYENITGTAPIVESWTKYDIITRPDQYTVFVLPGDETRWNFTSGYWETDLYNDYLITTSFLAPNANGTSELIDPLYKLPRAAFAFDVFNTEGIYINEIEAAPPGPPAAAPEINCSITPDGDVSSAEWIMATVNATHFKFPLTVKVDWDDGAQSTGVLADASDVFNAQHRYLAKGTYNVEAVVTDIYGNTGTCICGVVNVTSDGFRFVIGPGWNAISIPVNDTITVDDVFDPANHTWFTGVWRWDASTQDWESLTGTAELKSEWGLFVLGPPCGSEEFIVTGTAAGFTRSGWQSGWNLAGPGFNQVTVSEWTYFWNAMIYGYDIGHTMDPGRGYWVLI